SHSSAAFVLFAEIEGNRDADVSEVHHLPRGKFDVIAYESRASLWDHDFGQDLFHAHDRLTGAAEKFFQQNRFLTGQAYNLAGRIQCHQARSNVRGWRRISHVAADGGSVSYL